MKSAYYVSLTEETNFFHVILMKDNYANKAKESVKNNLLVLSFFLTITI